MLRFHLARNLPVIVEGVLAAKTLKSFGLEPDHLIRVRKVGHSGDCLSSGEYEQYECAFEDDDSVILPCAEVEGNGYNCSISGCKDGPTCNFCKVPTEAYEKGTKLWHD